MQLCCMSTGPGIAEYGSARPDPLPQKSVGADDTTNMCFEINFNAITISFLRASDLAWNFPELARPLGGVVVKS